MNTFRDICFDEALFLKSMFKTGDRDALRLYTYWQTSHAISYIYNEYARIFGLCKLLGTAHIYDIGCGGNYQACLLFHEHINYTGIAAYEHFDYDAMNRAFSDYCGKRIRFINEHYPCRLSPDPNNAAVIRGWKYVKGGEKHLKKLTEAISRDFDRVITNCGIMGVEWDENYQFWKQALPEYHVMKLGYENLIFATKVSDDLAAMEKYGYEYGNYHFSVRMPLPGDQE